MGDFVDLVGLTTEGTKEKKEGGEKNSKILGPVFWSMVDAFAEIEDTGAGLAEVGSGAGN